MPITLVLADHQPVALHGLMHLFAREQDFFVLASHANSAETLESVRRHQPAVLVLGMAPPATEGLTVLRKMQEENLPTRAVVFARGIDEQEIAEAIRLCARGVVLKEMVPRLLLQCIRKVHAGGEWFETCSIGHLVGRIRQGDATRNRAEALTRRQIEVVQRVAQGLNNQAIAQSLSIGEGTVKVHLHRIYGKLKVRNRVELLLYAREKGWV
ncbi:MAG: LuxR C-terminal-related transcriptional regulator [Gammaproteobacteria bacterium]